MAVTKKLLILAFCSCYYFFYTTNAAFKSHYYTLHNGASRADLWRSTTKCQIENFVKEPTIAQTGHPFTLSKM